MSYEYAVSACLCGQNVRYDGGSKSVDKWMELYKQGKVLLICPETFGGLSTPRNPSEQIGDRVIMNNGLDVTSNFEMGAKKALAMIQEHPSIHTIVLKENSPSCGTHFVYDGTFSGKKIVGQGVFASMAKEAGYRVVSDEE